MKKTAIILLAGLLAAGVTFGKVPNADATFYTISDIFSSGMTITLKAENETNRNGLDFEFDTGVLSADKDKYFDLFTGPSGWNTELYDKTVNGESRVFAKGSAVNSLYGSTNNNTKIFTLDFNDSISGFDFYQTFLPGTLRGAGFDGPYSPGYEPLDIHSVNFYNPFNRPNPNPNPVPEPGTLLLLGSGLLALSAVGRRKQKAASV